VGIRRGPLEVMELMTQVSAAAQLGGFACRGCGARVTRSVVDLGAMPLANSYVDPAALAGQEPRFPLHVFICDQCLLVQLDALVSPEELFSDYAYFSSYSSGWLEHARRFAEMAIARFGLSKTSKVVEIASNDGYLLSNFVERGIPSIGIEPAANVAEVALRRGIPTEVRFFGLDCARDLHARGDAADLVVANNVVAHVPDLRDFLGGVARLLKIDGVFSAEFPHLLRLLQHTQFDTIYHEHFSYLSLRALETVFAATGLRVFDIEQLPTHGGSLRIFACRQDSSRQVEMSAIEQVRSAEREGDLDRFETYDRFASRVSRCREQFLDFIRDTHNKGSVIAAYGAAAKGNTLLNFCGITRNDIVCVADLNVRKQGRYLPGSRIPVVAPERIAQIKPDYLLILPWNLREELMASMPHVRDWGCRFVIAIPSVSVFP
jgi:SAM-dependent methyltransferase